MPRGKKKKKKRRKKIIIIISQKIYIFKSQIFFVAVSLEGWVTIPGGLCPSSGRGCPVRVVCTPLVWGGGNTLEKKCGQSSEVGFLKLTKNLVYLS